MDIGTKLRLVFLIGLAVSGLLFGLTGLVAQRIRRVPRRGWDQAGAVTASVLVPREGRAS